MNREVVPTIPKAASGYTHQIDKFEERNRPAANDYIMKQHTQNIDIVHSIPSPGDFKTKILPPSTSASPSFHARRFDEVSKTLCLLARNVRQYQMVAALALSPRLAFGADAEKDGVSGSCLIAAADRATSTVAIFCCPLPGTTSTRISRRPCKEESPPPPIDGIDISATAPGMNGGVGRIIKRNGGNSDGGDVNGFAGVGSFRLVTVWVLRNVKCLEAVGSVSSDFDDGGDYPYRSESLFSAGSGGNVFGIPGDFFIGTASGAVKTLRVLPPSASR